MNLLPLSDFDCCLGISKAREDVVKLLLALFVFHFSLENCGCDDVAIRSKKCFILYPIVNWIISQAQVKNCSLHVPQCFQPALLFPQTPVQEKKWVGKGKSSPIHCRVGGITVKENDQLFFCSENELDSKVLIRRNFSNCFGIHSCSYVKIFCNNFNEVILYESICIPRILLMRCS